MTPRQTVRSKRAVVALKGWGYAQKKSSRSRGVAVLEADFSSCRQSMHEETGQPDAKNRGGKPLTISNDTLFSNRDCWVGLLSYWWADIGWRLSRARTADDVRAILASM